MKRPTFLRGSVPLWLAFIALLTVAAWLGGVALLVVEILQALTGTSRSCS